MITLANCSCEVGPGRTTGTSRAAFDNEVRRSVLSRPAPHLVELAEQQWALGHAAADVLAARGDMTGRSLAAVEQASGGFAAASANPR